MTRREARELALSTLYQLELRQNLKGNDLNVYDRDIKEVDLTEESYCHFLVNGILDLSLIHISEPTRPY